MNNLTYDGQIDLGDMKFINLLDKEIGKYTVTDGDILFNRTNSPDLVGKTAVYRGSERLAFAGYLVRLRTNQNTVPDYISAFLNSGYGKTVLRGMCKSIIGMANINAKELCSIPIPAPPIDLQQHFAEHLAKIKSTMAMFTKNLSKLDYLFASLQKRAFRGEL